MVIILYFSILLHCIVQWLLQVMLPSVCSCSVLVFTVSPHVSAYMAIFRCVGALLCWFPLSFTTCFGLHGHLQVCRIFYFNISADLLCWFSLSLTTYFGLHGHLQVCRIFYFNMCADLLCWFSLSLTTCFGQHGHLQVYRIFYFHMLEGFCLAAFFFFAFFARSHNLHVG
jgi:hypothetical protein